MVGLGGRAAVLSAEDGRTMTVLALLNAAWLTRQLWFWQVDQIASRPPEKNNNVTLNTTEDSEHPNVNTVCSEDRPLQSCCCCYASMLAPSINPTGQSATFWEGGGEE